MQKLSIICLLLIGSMFDIQSQSLTVTSRSFKHTKSIPKRYGYIQKNISPELSWSKGPKGTKSYVVVCTNSDASNTWLHWLVYNLPPDVTSLPENYNLEYGGKFAKNDYGKKGYGGPSHSSGIHRYYFKVYALDKNTILINANKKIDQKSLFDLLDKHDVAKGSLMGTYNAV